MKKKKSIFILSILFVILIAISVSAKEKSDLKVHFNNINNIVIESKNNITYGIVGITEDGINTKIKDKYSIKVNVKNKNSMRTKRKFENIYNNIYVEYSVQGRLLKEDIVFPTKPKTKKDFIITFNINTTASTQLHNNEVF